MSELEERESEGGRIRSRANEGRDGFHFAFLLVLALVQ